MDNALIVALSQNTESIEHLRSNVADAFYRDTRITRMVAHHANRIGLTEVDEIKQETVIIFTNKWLDRLDSPENVYFLLGDIIKRVCLGLKRNLMSHNEGRYTSLDHTQHQNESGGDQENFFEKVFRRDDDSLANADEDCINRVENSINRQALIREVRARLGRDSRLAPLEKQAIYLEEKLGLSPVIEVVPKEKMRASLQKPKNARAIASAEAIQRLGDIRLKLGMTIQDFAKILNSTKGAMTSYLYRRAAPPKKILLLAEIVLKERGCLVETANQRYAHRTMREITLDWAAAIGVKEEPEVIATLSKIFNTAPVTIKRWLNEKTRPDLQALQNYETKIRELAASQKVQAAVSL